MGLFSTMRFGLGAHRQHADGRHRRQHANAETTSMVSASLFARRVHFNRSIRSRLSRRRSAVRPSSKMRRRPPGLQRPTPTPIRPRSGLSNVDTTTEMTEMRSASRAYQANVTVLDSIKQMAQRSIDLGRA